MNLLNKKFILVYAIYIGIIALIYFFGKDFLLVFDNLKNFFLSVNPAYYMLNQRDIKLEKDRKIK
ncbi:hypothetical protein ACTK19_001695 [Campylobacter jejuni]